MDRDLNGYREDKWFSVYMRMMADSKAVNLGQDNYHYRVIIRTSRYMGGLLIE